MKNRNKAVTMIEIMFAVSILALTFIPTMALFTSNLQITDRDKANIIAMNLCQDRLNTALNINYKKMYEKKGQTISSGIIEIASPSVKLDLNPVTIEGIEFSFAFKIESKSITYHLKGFNTASSVDVSLTADDSTLNFEQISNLNQDITKTINDQVLIYKMMVSWRGKKAGNDGSVSGPGNGVTKDYSLMTYKANLESERLN